MPTLFWVRLGLRSFSKIVFWYKFLICWGLVLLCCTWAAAQSEQLTQENPGNRIFLSAGPRLGGLVGTGLGIGYNFRQAFTIEMGYIGFSHRAQEQPSDYQSGLFSLFILNADAPRDRFNGALFMLGKPIKLNAKGNRVLNLRGGWGYGDYMASTDFQLLSSSERLLFLISNYQYSKQYTWRHLYTISPQMQFAFDKVASFTVSPEMLFPEGRDFVWGLQIGVLVNLNSGNRKN